MQGTGSGGNYARSGAPPSRMREETHAGLEEAVTAAHSTCSLLAAGTGPFCTLISSRSDSSSFPSFPFLNRSNSPSPVCKSPLVLEGLYPALTLQALWLQEHLLTSAEELEPLAGTFPSLPVHSNLSITLEKSQARNPEAARKHRGEGRGGGEDGLRSAPLMFVLGCSNEAVLGQGARTWDFLRSYFV